MLCLECEGDSRVKDTRPKDDERIRWRVCLDCGHKWETRERLGVYSPAQDKCREPG